MNTLSFARQFGARAHGNQKYADRYPFLMHLDRVYWTLIEFGVNDPEVHIAAYLHDTLEDTPVTRDTLHTFFSDRVVAMVDGVTMRFQDDREKSLKWVVNVMAEGHSVHTLKLADRLSNVRLAVVEGTDRILDFYGKEHHIFQQAKEGPALQSHSIHNMWKELDDHLKEWIP